MDLRVKQIYLTMLRKYGRYESPVSIVSIPGSGFTIYTAYDRAKRILKELENG